ncbi:hypothetical protein JB92DRAFT_2847579 [Gautieria morchelliformis]|nr:hypothetical protein JB92DRAFT_2847579 [Gautieria morchelliformis]
MSIIVLGVELVSQSYTTYNTVAASMFTFWDYLLTFGDEVDLVWRSPFSWVTIMFYVIRYLTFFIRIAHLVFCTNAFGVVHVTASDCTIWRWFQVLSGQFLFCAIEILLITRVFAFYGRKKSLLAVLLLLLAAELSAMISLVAISLPMEVAKPNPIPHIHAAPCIGISQPKMFSSLWVPPLIMQSILFVLLLGRYFWTREETRPGSSSVLGVFFRDHAWAFLLIFAVCLWATLSYELTDHLGEVALTWTYTVLGFCGSRLILNLRSAGREGKGGNATFEDSELVFTSILDPLGSREIETTIVQASF